MCRDVLIVRNIASGFPSVPLFVLLVGCYLTRKQCLLQNHNSTLLPAGIRRHGFNHTENSLAPQKNKGVFLGAGMRYFSQGGPTEF